MVHNAANGAHANAPVFLCDGAQMSLRWSRQRDGQTAAHIYEPTMQYAQLGYKKLTMFGLIINQLNKIHRYKSI